MNLSAANREVSRIWRGKSQSPMLVMHLGFPVAGVVGAQIASHYVARKEYREGFNRISHSGSVQYDIFYNSTFNGSMFV